MAAYEKRHPKVSFAVVVGDMMNAINCPNAMRGALCVLLSARMRGVLGVRDRDPRHAKRAQSAPLIALGGGVE